jgi:hypothetical protein
MLSLGANPKNPTFAVVLRRWKPTPAVPMTQRRNRPTLPGADADSNQNPKLQRQL